jgi:hypothetical protein
MLELLPGFMVEPSRPIFLTGMMMQDFSFIWNPASLSALLSSARLP